MFPFLGKKKKLRGINISWISFYKLEKCRSKIICTALLQQDRTSLSYMLQDTEFLYVHFLTTKIWSSLITIFKQIAALQKTIKKNGRKKEISKTLLTHIIDGNLSQNANALTWSFWRIKILKNSKYKKGEGRIPC